MVEPSALSAIGELGLVRLVTRGFPKSSDLRLGIGDDAALLRLVAGPLLAVSKDLLVEGVHFDLSYFSPEDLGYKAISVNVSDICAMNGTASAVLVGLSVPSSTEPVFVERLYDGIRAACERYSISLAGGDTTASPGALFLSVTVLGTVEENLFAARAGAKAGDSIFVTGSLGLSAAGLELLRRGIHDERFAEPLRRHLRPDARTDVVEELRLLGVRPSAMIDVSDGLASELHHIASASGVGARLFAACIPVSEAVAEAARAVGKGPLDLAIGGGEDYELLFTVPANLEDAVRASKVATRIGVITESREIEIERDGVATPLRDTGYRHFDSPS